MIDPPDWLTQARAKAEQHKAMEPLNIAAKILGIKSKDLYDAACLSNADDQFTVKLARSWAADRSTAPGWLITLWAEKSQQQIEKRLKEEAERKAANDKVWDRLSKGAKSFRDNQQIDLENIVFAASKELTRGADASDLFPAERQALKLSGVKFGQHDTWLLHGGGCDGYGNSGGCSDRVEELQRAAEEQRKAQRRQRAVESRRSSEAIASGAFPVGTAVSLWRGGRAGKVVKINRTTVTVRHVGPKKVCQLRDGSTTWP